MILALVSALALASPVQRGLLVCVDAASCEQDARWLSSVGGGGPGGFEELDFERVIAVGAVPDGLADRDVYEAALVEARAAMEKGRWGAVLEATQAGLSAVSRWRGPVKTQELFELYYMRGAAAVELGRDRSQAYSFRQAVAIANGQDLAYPASSNKVQQAWLDEQRKALLAGKGELVLGGGPPGTGWKVNGRSVPAGTVALLPGNHRVSATAPGQVRSWTVEVPVLPDRSSRVEPDFASYEEQAAVYAALVKAVDTLQAAEPLADLLVAWCEAHGAEELRLMRLYEVVEPLPVSPVLLGPEPTDRPAAAAGEAVDMGDGVPTTFEGEVLQRHRAQDEGHVQRATRLRMVFFDPATRRFSADPSVSTALQESPERLRILARAGGMRAMGRSHLGLDLGLLVPVGPVRIDGRLGWVRADRPYNLYEDWVDHQLAHLYLGARWSPDWAVAPFVGAGAEVLAPAAFGGRLGAGVDLRFARDWQTELELTAGLLDKGLQVGGGLALGRSF